MQWHFFTVPALDPESATDVLNQFLSANAVAGVERQFVADGQHSFWSICVQVAGTATAPAKAHKGRRVDYREILGPEAFARYARLREVRNRMAKQQGVPPYAIFTNEQLARISELEAPDRSDLAAIEGIGDKRIALYADALLHVLRDASA